MRPTSPPPEPRIKLQAAICERRAGATHQFQQPPNKRLGAEDLAEICADSEAGKFQKCKISQSDISECNKDP
jgi:hypothetical protein